MVSVIKLRNCNAHLKQETNFKFELMVPWNTSYIYKEIVKTVLVKNNSNYFQYWISHGAYVGRFLIFRFWFLLDIMRMFQILLKSIQESRLKFISRFYSITYGIMKALDSIIYGMVMSGFSTIICKCAVLIMQRILSKYIEKEKIMGWFITKILGLFFKFENQKLQANMFSKYFPNWST